MAIANVQTAPRVSRRNRQPVTPFHVEHKAHYLQPICCFPVLAGETLKNLMWQSRAVTDPLKSPLIGWHAGYYFFYVKLRHISITETKNLFTNPAYTPAAQFAHAYYTANSPAFYKLNTGTTTPANFIEAAYRVVVQEWFRNEQDASILGSSASTLYKAQRKGKDVFESLMSGKLGTEIGVNVDLDVDGTITAQEIEQAMHDYDALKERGLTDLTYEEYLAQQGIRQQRDDLLVTQRPELLRYIEEWSYPANSVDPTSGVPSSAVSWAVQGRGDKDRFFTEPGFILGLTCMRPKTFNADQRASMTQQLMRMDRWPDRSTNQDSVDSWYEFDSNDGAIVGTKPASLDMFDLFYHGEQFISVDPTAAGTDAAVKGRFNLVTYDDAAKRYPADASLDNLFKNSVSTLIRQDGVVQATILSHVWPEKWQSVSGSPVAA